MTIFVSQRANRDPKPYEYENGHRNSVGGSYAGMWPMVNPRPECTQTNDPEPWVTSQGVRSEFPIHGRSDWAPRHDEFDPPVNRILADLRLAVESTGVSAVALAQLWIADPNQHWRFHLVPFDEFGHAHRVLTLVAALS